MNTEQTFLNLKTTINKETILSKLPEDWSMPMLEFMLKSLTSNKFIKIEGDDTFLYINSNYLIKNSTLCFIGKSDNDHILSSVEKILFDLLLRNSIVC